jgi:ureidoglycolate hydrolase
MVRFFYAVPHVPAVEPAPPRRIVMVPFAGLSRRAFVVASALAATVPSVVAARRRKSAPEAFLAIAVQGVTMANGAFVWHYQAQFDHPPSNFSTDVRDTLGIGFPASQELTRQAIIAGARSAARTDLLLATNQNVPEDRIAVVLF